MGCRMSETFLSFSSEKNLNYLYIQIKESKPCVIVIFFIHKDSNSSPLSNSIFLAEGLHSVLGTGAENEQ